ncbi:MAG TPA: hypothetical protein VGD81_18065 [Opitutaceae bacterium]
MSTEISSRFATVARALPPPSATLTLSAAFAGQLSSLYGLVQRSRFVFASPLGPFYTKAHPHHLPRFVYFGPHTSEESLRLAFYTGFAKRDLRGTLALLRFVERLALSPDIGQGLHLSFFPLIDVLGLGEDRALATAHWAHTAEPELDLLNKDARLRAYHGFVRLESASFDDHVTVRLRGATEVIGAISPGVELITSDEIDPLPVAWESEPPTARTGDGPLSIADDLPVQPFELTLRIPAAWNAELHREAVASILKRFVLRYRGLQAYAQHL